jgi:4-hydroxybenzoate polyprenyltransferase
MTKPSSPFSPLVAWLQLVRLPNTFTVIADGLAGLAVARSAAAWSPLPLSFALIGGLIALYWAGMVLNDVFDFEKDRLQGRGRPLTDGRIGLPAARLAGYGLLFSGILAIGLGAGWTAFSASDSAAITPQDQDVAPSLTKAWPTVAIAIGLAFTVWLYDSPLNGTIIGPWLMGGCRFASLLLGMSVGWWLEPTQSWASPHSWVAALGHGLYVSGITWAARREAEIHQDWTLKLGWAIAACGVALLASVSCFYRDWMSLRLTPTVAYPLAIGLMAIPTFRRAWVSIAKPSPATIQAAIKQAILSMIFFDAVLTLQFAGPWPALLVCSLILPALFSGRWLRST